MNYDQTARKSASLGLAARTNEGGAQGEAETGTPHKSEEGGASLGGHCASKADAGGEAAVRFNKRTYLDNPTQGRHRLFLRDYGDGLVEIGWSFVSAKKPNKAAKGESLNAESNQGRAVRRARTRLRQLILAAHLDHLLTLTYRENQTDYDQATQDLSRFIRKVRKTLPDWLYVAVPERQKRGAWHWHLAVKGRQDVDLLRACWRAVVNEGNIDVQPPKHKTGNRRLGIVNYLSKYLAKTFTEDERIFHGHRFRASQGIYIPCTPIPVPKEERANFNQYAISQLLNRAGKVGFVWVDNQMLAGWACSWN